MMLTVTLFTLLSLAAHLSLGATDCPQGCTSCTNGRFQCAGAGLRDFQIQIPDNTQSLDFTQNNIQDIDNVPSLPNLNSLRLSMNQISIVKGDTFANVPSLISLDLSMNDIRKVYKHGLRGLKDLMTLSLSGNKIRDIGIIFINTPMLTSVKIGNNEIERINNDNFESNNMLKMLDLSNNKISFIEGEAFKNLEMLRYLILSNNPIKTATDLVFSSTMLSLADFTNCQLTSVPRKMPQSLVDFRLGTNQIEKITTEDFENITSLRMLTLNDNKISHVDHRSFGDNVKLSELWISRNQLVYIPRGLPKSLKKLFMNNNVVVELEQMLFSENSSLTVLNLENNKIFKVHEVSLKNVKNLESLNLQGNNITEILAGTFANVPSMNELSLTNNPIQKIEQGAFDGLDSLQDLSMAYIPSGSSSSDQVLPHDFFTTMPKLATVDMMNSLQLTKASLKIAEMPNVTPLENLKKWNMQFNELTSLPENLKNMVPNIKQLLLDGNLFTCDARLKWLNQWMTSSSVAFHQYEKSACHSPDDLKGQEISALQPQDFKASEDLPPPPPSGQNNNQIESQSGSRNNEATTKENVDTNTDKNEVASTDTSGSQTDDTANSSIDQKQTERYSIGGTVVKIKPSSRGVSDTSHESQRAKEAMEPATPTERPLTRKEQRKLERQRKRRLKELRKRQRRNKKKSDDKRTKRHNKNNSKAKRCKKDGDGNVKCRKGRGRKRCKVQDDGTVRCKKRKDKKKDKTPTVVDGTASS